jgi:hypothetical protein
VWLQSTPAPVASIIARAGVESTWKRSAGSGAIKAAVPGVAAVLTHMEPYEGEARPPHRSIHSLG